MSESDDALRARLNDAIQVILNDNAGDEAAFRGVVTNWHIAVETMGDDGELWFTQFGKPGGKTWQAIGLAEATLIDLKWVFEKQNEED